MDMMAKARTVSDDIRDAQKDDKIALPDAGSDYIDSLSFADLIALRDKVVARIEALKSAELEAFRRETAERAAKLGVSVTEIFGGGVASRAAKAPTARVAQEPPAGAEIFKSEDGTKIWWRGKRGKRPDFAPKD